MNEPKEKSAAETAISAAEKETYNKSNIAQVSEKSKSDYYMDVFRLKQKLPYEAKVELAKRRVYEFYDECNIRGLNTHISVGGLDSITLLVFIRSLGFSAEMIPAISVSILEDKGNQEIHRQLGVTPIKPFKTKTQVINQLGFPVISKAKANKIEYLQTPDSPKQTFIHAIMTGDMGEQGHFQHSEKIKLPDKYIEMFGGYYQSHRPDLQCKIAPFKVSAKCCKYMKEDPCDAWAKEHNSVPYLGLMASEGGQRELALMKNGCNYFGKDTIRSCPFATFMRQDLLQLALDLDVPVPKAYGEIKRKSDGTLYTTRAQRTGCSMCGFGIQFEKRPHRFDRLHQDNINEWNYWMYNCCTDENGNKYGWGKVLDYIGVDWEWENNQMVSKCGQLRFEQEV